MGITFQEVIDNQLLSEDVINCLPKTCDCGAEVLFTDSLRQIYCSNPRCTYKVAARLEAMAKHMKADGWGESTCITVCKEFGMISPYQVFLLPAYIAKGRTSSVSAFEKKVANICDPEKRKVELWEVVKYGGIPGVETIAFKIFGGYETILKAYDDIEKGQVPFIAEKLGIKNTEASVMAVNVYNRLIEYKEELLFAEQQFEIYKPTGQTIYMAITGAVYGYRNKSEFVKYLNDRYKGKANIMFMGSVTNQVDILVADIETNHSKYDTAIRINTKYVENLLKSGKYTKDDLGKFVNERDLHPIGEKILITNGVGAIQRLDKVFK